MKKSQLVIVCLSFILCCLYSRNAIAQQGITVNGTNKTITSTSQAISFAGDTLKTTGTLNAANANFSVFGTGNTGLATYNTSGILQPLNFNGNANTVLTGAGTFATFSGGSSASGAGTVGYVPVWTTTSTIGNSPIAILGGNVGIGTSTPQYPLHVFGDAAVTGNIYGQNVYAQNNISAGNFRFVNGTVMGVSDTIASQGTIQINAQTVSVSGALTAQALSATALSVTGPSVAMPGIVTDTATDLMGITAQGAVKPLSATAVYNIVFPTNGTNTTILNQGCKGDAPVWHPVTANTEFMLQQGGGDIVYSSWNTDACTFVGIGTWNTISPDAPLNISNANTNIQLSVTNPTKLNDVFTIDKSGNTVVNGSLSVYTSGANNSLFFGQDQITTFNSSPTGEWGVMYVPANDGTPKVGGLNFWKPFASGHFGNAFLWLSDDGNVGIGTSSPSTQLNVMVPNITNPSDPFSITNYQGNSLLMVHNDEGGSMELGGSNSTVNTVAGGKPYIDFHYGTSVAQDFNIRLINSADGEMDFYTENTTVGEQEVMSIISNSNGNYVRALEIRVCITGCDFVFDKDYKLMPLNDLEQYLNLNHHLPGIASAKEMESGDGVALGKMNSQLLQKVEELTLYTIELKKQLDEMQAEIAKMKAGK